MQPTTGAKSNTRLFPGYVFWFPLSRQQISRFEQPAEVPKYLAIRIYRSSHEVELNLLAGYFPVKPGKRRVVRPTFHQCLEPGADRIPAEPALPFERG